MNLPKYPIGEGGFPDITDIQKLVESSFRYSVQEIDNFNVLAKLVLSDWNSGVNNFVSYNKNETTTQKVQLKLWQPAGAVESIKLFLKHKSLEVTDREPVHLISVNTTKFNSLGMLAHEGVIGVVFVDLLPDTDFDEAVFVPAIKTNEIRISSQVLVSNI